MKVFCLAPNPHANGAGLNFKRNLRPAALVCFTRRENFKNFKECKEAVNLPLEARIANRAVDVRSLGSKACVKTADREAVSARHASPTCRDAKTARTTPIGAAVSKNISNLAPLKHCADMKNFKIFASGKIKFAMQGELKFVMRSMAKFAARCGLKFEPCSTAARGFTTRDKILNSSSRENCVSSKISSQRGEKAK
ncbi:hypothetical protein [uncultured Campylobacter sp.]|uniref:hypothetical protein n=1 Tax=uncultured Campylobacter sp. TaxID=218934 RepID=UPI0026352A13|nr:hypothetical protein [uncultured Campylobacter sp.]